MKNYNMNLLPISLYILYTCEPYPLFKCKYFSFLDRICSYSLYFSFSLSSRIIGALGEAVVVNAAYPLGNLYSLTHMGFLNM